MITWEFIMLISLILFMFDVSLNYEMFKII